MKPHNQEAHAKEMLTIIQKENGKGKEGKSCDSTQTFRGNAPFWSPPNTGRDLCKAVPSGLGKTDHMVPAVPLPDSPSPAP